MIKLTKHQKSEIAAKVNKILDLKCEIWDLMSVTEKKLGHDFLDFENQINNLIGHGVTHIAITKIEKFINSLEIDGE